MNLLRPLLPDRYSPLQANGNGIQSVYLAPVPEMLAETLIALIGPEALSVQQNTYDADHTMTAANADLEIWEHHIESQLDQDTAIPTTEREALITARRSQGLFKERVMQIGPRLRPGRGTSRNRLCASRRLRASL